MVASGELAAATGRGWTGYAPLDAPGRVRYQAAAGDIAEGLRRWRGWSYLALETIKNQYRRTVLGPWWLTLQTGAYVLGITVIFGHILKTGTKSFLPYVAMGFIGFNLLSGLTRAASTVFVGASATMKSTRQPLSTYVLRDITIEFIQFAHNMVYYVIFLAVGLVPLSPKILIAVPIVLVIAVNGFFAALWLGPAVARFRDVGPLVNSVLQVLIFFTPIFYRIQNLGSSTRQKVIAWNPFTYLLGAFRSPLIGHGLRPADYILAAIITVADVVLGFVVFSRCRSRLPYWVS